jgi:hypothetical protein
VFQRLQEGGHSKHFLDTQYRMHPQIAYFPSRHFYDGRLKTSASVLAAGPASNADGAAGGVLMGSASARSPLQRCRSTHFEFAMGTYVVLDVPFSVVKRSTSKCVRLLRRHSPTLLSTHALAPAPRSPPLRNHEARSRQVLVQRAGGGHRGGGGAVVGEAPWCDGSRGGRGDAVQGAGASDQEPVQPVRARHRSSHRTCPCAPLVEPEPLVSESQLSCGGSLTSAHTEHRGVCRWTGFRDERRTPS